MRRLVTVGCLAAATIGLLAVSPITERCGSEAITPVAWKIDTVATGLQVPWALAFANDGKLFFSERAGRISVIDRPGASPRLVARVAVATSPIPGFATGLLGLAVDPQYPAEPYLYAYYTYRTNETLLNRLVRFRDLGDSLVQDGVILDSVPGSTWQNGGRIKFGPDGKLYVPTGAGESGPRLLSEAQNIAQGAPRPHSGRDDLAQDKHSLIGKVLRLNRDGSIPADNPFPGSLTYSYGHRNPQGLAWHPETGMLYDTEHGPPGGWDELNRVERGGNYGWPIFKGATVSVKLNARGFQAARNANVKPVAAYVPSIAPAGLAFYSGRLFPQWANNLFIAALHGKHLRRVELDADGVSVKCQEALFENTYGRLRAVTEAPDGSLYIGTSNMDQDWVAPSTEDFILRIVPQ